MKRVSKASIAKILGVSRTAMHHFINSRKLAPQCFTAAVSGSSRLKDIFAVIWSLPLETVMVPACGYGRDIQTRCGAMI